MPNGSVELALPLLRDLKRVQSIRLFHELEDSIKIPSLGTRFSAADKDRGMQCMSVIRGEMQWVSERIYLSHVCKGCRSVDMTPWWRLSRSTFNWLSIGELSLGWEGAQRMVVQESTQSAAADMRPHPSFGKLKWHGPISKSSQLCGHSAEKIWSDVAWA